MEYIGERQDNMTWKIKKLGKVSIRNPILIEGLPGIGNVGKIAIDFIIDNLNAKKLFEIYSYSFPSVFVNEDNLVELPVIEVYYKKLGNKTLLLLSGDIQPMDEESCYEFCEQILDMFQSFKGKEIITLGGIGMHKAPKNPKVYCTANTKSIIGKYKVDGVSNDIYGVVGSIIGVSGLLLGLAGQRRISAVSLLAETFGHPTHMGIKEAKEVLKALNKSLGLKLDLNKLDKEIKGIEKDIKVKSKEFNRLTKNIQKSSMPEDVSYIG